MPTAILLFAVLTAARALAGDTLYVQGEQLPLRAEPTPASSVVALLTRGQAVSSRERRSGLWLQVQAGGREGWVPSISLGKVRVAEAGSMLDNGKDISQGARKRSSTVSTAGAARGLLQGNDALVTGNVRGDAAALRRMMSFRVLPAEAAEFVKQ